MIKHEIEKITNIVIAAYNQISESYAEAYQGNDEQDFHYFDNFIHNLNGANILDMGCGIGVNADYLTKKGYNVIGIDAAVGMLAEARRKYPNLKFEEQNMLNTSFDDVSFDGVVLTYVIEHFNNDGQQCLKREIDRLLPSGGLVFVATHVGETEELIADPLDNSITIYYNFSNIKKLDELFFNYERISYCKRASYGAEEFLCDKMFVVYRKG